MTLATEERIEQDETQVSEESDADAEDSTDEGSLQKGAAGAKAAVRAVTRGAAGVIARLRGSGTTGWS